MTVELIDGCAGKPHISGDDLGNFKAGIVGTDGYVLATGNEFAATLESANSLVIDTGAAIMPTTGRHVRITAPETLTITSGTQGNKRNDLVVLRTVTSTDSTTVESASLVVIKGTATTGTAADPATQDGDLLLYRVSLSGISVSTPVSLFTSLTPLASLQASVDRVRLLRGTEVLSGSSWQTVKTRAELASYFGCTTSDIIKHVVPIVYNGDFSANSCMVRGDIENDGRFVVLGNTSGTYRVTYFLIYV